METQFSRYSKNTIFSIINPKNDKHLNTKNLLFKIHNFILLGKFRRFLSVRDKKMYVIGQNS